MIHILIGLFSLDQHCCTVVTFLTLDNDLSPANAQHSYGKRPGQPDECNSAEKSNERAWGEPLHGSQVIMKIMHGVCLNLIIAILSIFFACVLVN